MVVAWGEASVLPRCRRMMRKVRRHQIPLRLPVVYFSLRKSCIEQEMRIVGLVSSDFLG